MLKLVDLFVAWVFGRIRGLVELDDWSECGMWDSCTLEAVWQDSASGNDRVGTSHFNARGFARPGFWTISMRVIFARAKVWPAIV